MKKLLKQAALDFFGMASQEQVVSALVFFDDKINPYIDDRLYMEYMDAWFCTLINEFEILDETIKNQITFEISDNDIFAASISENNFWKSFPSNHTETATPIS